MTQRLVLTLQYVVFNIRKSAENKRMVGAGYKQVIG